MADKFINSAGLSAIKAWIVGLLTGKQDTLVSGDSIKTLNGESMLGSGNVAVGKVTATTRTQFSLHAVDVNGNQNNVLGIQKASYDNHLVITSYDRETQQTVFSIEVVDIGDLPSIATDSVAGLVKGNSAQNIEIEADGTLKIGGRMGKFQGTTGLFAPNDRDPRNVGNYSVLVTDAIGVDMPANRSMAVVSGLGIACKSAAAGATEYRISNTYANRIAAKMAEGGYASRDEATSTQQRIVQILSVTVNGSAFTPDSSANDSSKDIVIKTAETLNPDAAITNIRLFGKMGSYATIHTGNGVRSDSGGRNLILGGGVTKAGSGNDNCLVGQNIYSSGNGNACFGRQHIATKNRGFLAGTGHDSTNAPSEGASAIGQFSYMDSQTLFAVGNGTSQTARSNAFEVRNDGSAVLKSPNGTRWKISVDDSGNLVTSAL